MLGTPCQGQCKGVTMSFQSITTTNDFLVLKLGHFNLVLGVQWLETLGLIVVD